MVRTRIDLEGFDELEKLLETMTLTEEDEKKAINAALIPVKEEVEKNVPVGKTGNLKKSIRTQMAREDGQTVGKVIVGKHYGRFQEYGTSTQKKNVGFFERSIRASREAATGIIKTEILSRLK